MFRKKYVAFVWLVFTLLVLSPTLSQFSYIFEEINLNPNDYARITDVEYTAVVIDEPGSQGKVLITERLTFDVHAASKNNLFYELWRDLPEDYIDGVKVDYTVLSVKQILEDGTEIIYKESPKLYWDDWDYVRGNPLYGPGKWYHSEGPYDEADAQYECVFFYVDGLYREEVVFEIVYEMHNAALRYNDCSDLYLSLYSGETIEYLNSFRAEILFPDKDMPASGNYNVYTYGTNSNEFPVKQSDSLNPGYYTFYFKLDEDDLQFKAYNQYIEFDLVAYGEDKHIFTEYAPSNYYSSDDVLDEIYAEQEAYATAPARFKTIKTWVLIFSAAGALLVIIYALTTDRRMKSKHVFYKPFMKWQHYTDIPSDLDPNFAAALVFCKDPPRKDDSGIYSAILLSLARKKYVKLTEKYPDEVLIKINKPPVTPEPVPTVAPSSVTYETQPSVTTDSMAAPILNAEQAEVSEPILTTQQLVAVEQQLAPETAPEYEPLTPSEEYYYNLLVRHASEDTITLSQFQTSVSYDYENTDSFVRNMQNSIVNIGIGQGYFQKADYKQPGKQINSQAKWLVVIGIILITIVNMISCHTRMDLAFGAFFILGIACILSAYYLNKQSNKYALLTQFGEDEYAKWRGLYNFLNNETLIHNHTITELEVWEKYLVYATAFGLPSKVIEAIGINCPETVAESSPILHNSYYRSKRFHHRSRSFRSAVRSSSSMARRSSGSFGGFGYGGGGRGGGGGGGGH